MPYFFSSQELPDNVVKYLGPEFNPLTRSLNDYSVKFAEIDREFPFNDLKIGDEIEVHFKDGFTVVHLGRITEILDTDPLSFKTIAVSNHRSNEGVDYPVTEKEYLGKIVRVFPTFEDAVNAVNKTT